MPATTRPLFDKEDFDNKIGCLDKKIETVSTATNDTKVKVSGMEQQINQLVNIADDNKKAIFGTADRPGILTRLSSIEIAIADVKKLIWIIITLGLGLLGTTVYNIIIEHAAQVASAAH